MGCCAHSLSLRLLSPSSLLKVYDTEVEGIFYGELPRDGGKSNWEKAKLYDLTAYKYLTDVVGQLKDLELSNPTESLKMLLDM